MPGLSCPTACGLFPDQEASCRQGRRCSTALIRPLSDSQRPQERGPSGGIPLPPWPAGPGGWCFLPEPRRASPVERPLGPTVHQGGSQGSSARFLTPDLTGLPDQPAALPTSKVTGHPAESCPFLTVWRPAVLRGGVEPAARACRRAPMSRHPTSSAPTPRRARFPAPALPAQR